MKKETIKTTVLAFLVVTSIILTINNWFSEKLWPDGYNFFSNLANYFSIGQNQKSYYLSKENVSIPSKIVVNNNDLRGLYTHTSKDFDDMAKTIKDVLKSGLKEKENVEKGTGEVWKEALKYKSIYFSYPVSYDIKTFSAILDTSINAITGGSVQEFIIVSGDNITGRPHLIAKSTGEDVYTDITLPLDSVEIDKLIEKYAASSSGEYPYSFELNFDKSEDSKEQKVTIDSQVTLYIKPVATVEVSEINYFKDIWENEELYSQFLRPFGFNFSNTRKNVSPDSSIVFAENYGTIKMYPDGLLEFKSLNSSKGIDIGNSGEFYDTFIDCIEFVNNVWDIACSDENMNINLSSVKRGDTDNSFTLTIDYYAEGMGVVTRIPATDSHTALNHAIEIEVVGSKIVSYRQAVYGYRSNGNRVSCTGVIEALDTLMANESIESDKITDLYMSYYTIGDGKARPHWIAKTDKNETRIIKNR